MTTIATTTPLRSSPSVIDHAYSPVAVRESNPWSPILMGAVTAIGLQFVFTVLGIALGATVADTTDAGDGSTAGTVGIAAGLWWLISGTVALHYSAP